MKIFITLLLIVVVALWWAGFAPFPTNPVTLASYNTSGFCHVQENNWAKCEPHNEPTPKGSLWIFRLFNGPKPENSRYGQWGVEGFNGCWDSGCRDIWQDADSGMLSWKIYNDTEVPHFGLGRPKYIVMLVGRGQDSGAFAESAFTTYSACTYRKPPDTDTEFYKCQLIEAGDAWKVGAIGDQGKN